jgi:hypothetical protein
MKPAIPLQPIIDPFVKGFQAELVADMVGNNNPPPSADYLFRRHNVIAGARATFLFMARPALTATGCRWRASWSFST